MVAGQPRPHAGAGRARSRPGPHGGRHHQQRQGSGRPDGQRRRHRLRGLVPVGRAVLSGHPGRLAGANWRLSGLSRPSHAPRLRGPPAPPSSGSRPAGQRPRRRKGRQQRQVALPGQYEPRAAHAAERGDRLCLLAQPHRSRAQATRRRRRHPGQRRALAGDDQRHPGHRQDRGRQVRTGRRAVRPARMSRRRRRHVPPAGRGKGPDLRPRHRS